MRSDRECGERSRETRIRLRQMELSDIDALLPYEQDMFGTEAWSRSSYRSEITDRHRHYVAAQTGDGVFLGWAGVMVIGVCAEILTVGVIPVARRVGVARRLVAALLAEAIRRGATECFLEVRVDNPAARELYRSEGFVDVGLRRGYYAGGCVDGVTMRKVLVEP